MSVIRIGRLATEQQEQLHKQGTVTAFPGGDVPSVPGPVAVGGAPAAPATPPAGGGIAPPQKPEQAIGVAIDKIAAFIPSEVLGIYVAGLGIFSPTEISGKWAIFGVCTGLIPVFMLLGYLLQRKRGLPAPSAASFIVLCGFALVSFTAYSAAVPSSPFLALSPKATVIGGWAAVILSVILYKIAELFDLVPGRN